jgi:hypothetical protein
MDFLKIYEIGRSIPFGFTIEKDEKKLKDIYFNYSSKEITATAIIIFSIILFFYLLAGFISGTLSMIILFMGLVVTIFIYIYPSHIYYSQVIMEYNEQMFKAVLSLSNFISMNTSLEFAFLQTTDLLRGILRKEFQLIINSMQRKDCSSLGEAFEVYVVKWNSVNKTFVKSLRLLQTALMAEEEEKDTIIKETIETLLINFKVHGKRSVEDLAQKSKNLISFGVLLPVMSLMLLPLLSIFMADFLPIGGLFFIYNVLFPTIMLLVALDFANKRIQIDSIKLEESPNYKKIPSWVYYIGLIIILLFSIPSFTHITAIDMTSPTSAEKEYSLKALVNVWLAGLGLILAILFISKYYIHKHKDEWNDVKLAEDDLPHLLHIFGTFLSLNISLENILPSIAKDYKEEGFKKHPVARVFSELSSKLLYAKGSLDRIINKTLMEICPSKKISTTLTQILSFAKISQESATKATKSIRSQTIATMELDDYIRTLLAETSSLISMAVTMLLPVLCGVAIIMSILIVKSIDFITQELAAITASLGSEMDFNLINITTIIPPTILELIIIIYFIQMYLILSLFSTKIEIGNDRFKFAEKLANNTMGFWIFSIIIIGGHFMLIELFFKGLLN